MNLFGLGDEDVCYRNCVDSMRISLRRIVVTLRWLNVILYRPMHTLLIVYCSAFYWYSVAYAYYQVTSLYYCTTDVQSVCGLCNATVILGPIIVL